MDFLQGFADLMERWAASIVDLLPASPFRPYLNALGGLPYLGYINWLIPVGAFIKIGSTWLAAITGYYVIMAILRWIGAID